MRKSKLLTITLVLTLTLSSVLSAWGQPRHRRKLIKLNQKIRNKKAVAAIMKKKKEARKKDINLRVPFAMKEGIRLMRAERFEEASERFFAVIKQYPLSIRTRLLLATCLMRLNHKIED